MKKSLFLFLILILLPLLVFAEKTHQVKPGESLEKIAKKYGVTVEDLKRWNNLRSNVIRAGEVLIIKDKEVAKREAKKETKKEVKKEEEPKIHIVKTGETLRDIAKKYGVSVEELKAWNNLTTNKPKPGTKLILQPPTEKAEKSNIYHVVKKGETLETIAKKYGTTPTAIKELNNLKQDKVYAGQKLLVKRVEEEKEVLSKKPKKPEAERSSDLFSKLQERERQLLKQNPTRKTYISLASEYRRLFLLYPSSEFAPLALLRTAELYDEVYQKFLKKEDLSQAVKYYEQFLKHYPGHTEERRVFERLIQIYAEDLKDKNRAKVLEEEYRKKYKIELAKEKKGKAKEKREPELKAEPKPEVKLIPSKEQALVSDVKKIIKVEPITGEDYTRIIVDVSGNFEYQANILPETKDRPPRIYVDIYPVILSDTVEREINLEHKHLQRIRVGQFDKTTVRIVLDLSSLTSYKLFKVKEPHQLIIDLVGKEKKELKPYVTKEAPERKKETRIAKKKEKAVAEEKRQPKEEITYIPLARQLGLGVKRVVIDAGHGGDDPGAVGPNGLKEKDVALKIALKLGELLRDRLGLEVIYTRSSDVFVPLVKRPAIANSMKADLFISIHLNASPDPKAKGVEVYYLNFTTDPEAMRVAALENSVANKGLADLQDLVKALISNTKLSESRALAEKVQRELVQTLRRHYPDVVDRGVKYAPFLVLVGTRMPAILVEAEFITNPEMAERLKDDRFVELIAEGLAKGVESYVNSLKISISNLSKGGIKIERTKP
ncbi:MAG: N-acetylmuramoyl-L-alanine amidase [Thermodesulfobacterium sp.]|nr:N-acetylmuramoyl-L-alanine amidase [Thermodesulfobacterium sp.]